MKKLRIPILVALLIGLIAAIIMYQRLFSSNTAFQEEQYIFYLHTGSSYESLVQDLTDQNIIKDVSTFQFTSRLKKFHDNIKPGRYVIRQGANNMQLVNMFRSGDQKAQLVPVENCWTLSELAGKLAVYLESDSLAINHYFLDPAVADSNGFKPETFPCMFIANRYDLFWNTSPQKFVNKMKKVHDEFWTEERIHWASEINLTPIEVYTLASIVKAETAKKDEASKIAGLYLNRLKIGMKLQSDPTALFAGQKRNVQRVYNNDLLVNSPYNTYMYDGLPPGPIGITEGFYIDAVLNYNKHDYIFMCAKSDFSGYHDFSKTLAQHEEYRRAYRKALDGRNISR